MLRNQFKKVILAGILALVALAMPEGSFAQDPQDKNYIIGPGDILEIKVWDHADLDRKVEVSQEGSFTFPFAGRIQVADKSVFALEKMLTEKLADGYIIDPQISISVSEYKNQKVYLFGEVNRPGSYVIKGKMNLMELISEAGGFTEERGSTCLIVRPKKNTSDGKPLPPEKNSKNELLELDIDRIVSGDSENFGIFVMPGDSVYIKKAESFFVTGEVVTPGRLKWEKGLTVRQAISIAGGGTPRAALNRVRIVRNKDGMEKEFEPKLGDIVMPNDIIKVPESWF
jgi:polysaccharide export outer membrane protein